jgi:hypothetical protein
MTKEQEIKEKIASRVMNSFLVIFGEKITPDDELSPTSSMFAHKLADQILSIIYDAGYRKQAEADVEKIKAILSKDLINRNCTHENPPPGHECNEECGVSLEDCIASSNRFTSPLHSGGKKHKKCMDCWNEYLEKLARQLLPLLSPKPELKLISDEKILQAWNRTGTTNLYTYQEKGRSVANAQLQADKKAVGE